MVRIQHDCHGIFGVFLLWNTMWLARCLECCVEYCSMWLARCFECWLTHNVVANVFWGLFYIQHCCQGVVDSIFFLLFSITMGIFKCFGCCLTNNVVAKLFFGDDLQHYVVA